MEHSEDSLSSESGVTSVSRTGLTGHAAVAAERQRLSVTHRFLPIVLNVTTALLALYGAVRFALWTWGP